MHAFVPVQFFDQSQELLLVDGGRELHFLGEHAQLLARALLGSHVSSGGGIVPDENDGQAGGHAPARELGHVPAHFIQNGGGDLFAIDDLWLHAPFLLEERLRSQPPCAEILEGKTAGFRGHEILIRS